MFPPAAKDDACCQVAPPMLTGEPSLTILVSALRGRRTAEGAHDPASPRQEGLNATRPGSRLPAGNARILTHPSVCGDREGVRAATWPLSPWLALLIDITSSRAVVALGGGVASFPETEQLTVDGRL